MKSRNNTNVFVSFHHELNQEHANEIRKIVHSLGYNDISVNDGVKIEDEDIKTDEQIRKEIRDNFLRNVDVTIVIVGEDTINRKHIDWEIRSSIYKFENGRNGSIVVVNALVNDESWIVDRELIELHDGMPFPAGRSWPTNIDSNYFEWLPFRLSNSLTNNYDYYSSIAGAYRHAVFPIILYGKVKNKPLILDRAIQHSIEEINRNKGKWDTNEKLMRQNREGASRKKFLQHIA